VGAGTPDENAEVLRSVLGGAQGTERSLTVMNAGAAIYAAGTAPDLQSGARKAEEAIDSGAAADVLERFVERTNR
jgi:anthranilate phosphoribosyltransferase